VEMATGTKFKDHPLVKKCSASPLSLSSSEHNAPARRSRKKMYMLLFGVCPFCIILLFTDLFSLNNLGFIRVVRGNISSHSNDEIDDKGMDLIAILIPNSTDSVIQSNTVAAVTSQEGTTKNAHEERDSIETEVKSKKKEYQETTPTEADPSPELPVPSIMNEEKETKETKETSEEENHSKDDKDPNSEAPKSAEKEKKSASPDIIELGEEKIEQGTEKTPPPGGSEKADGSKDESTAEETPLEPQVPTKNDSTNAKNTNAKEKPAKSKEEEAPPAKVTESETGDIKSKTTKDKNKPSKEVPKKKDDSKLKTGTDKEDPTKSTSLAKSSSSSPHYVNVTQSSLNPSVVHIIQTSFMQRQPNLVNLAAARLELFRVFCLPSMVYQTSKNFIWIIRTDPDLDSNIRDRLIEMIKPYPKFFLLSSNENPFGFRYSSRIEKTISDGKQILSGDIDVLKKAHNLAQTSIVLETSLDSDDGLHLDFCNRIQEQAKLYLATPERQESSIRERALRTTTRFHEDGRQLKSKTREEQIIVEDARWMVWCAHAHLEWHPDFPFRADDTAFASSRGYIVGSIASNCVTAGLTTGYGVRTPRSAVPWGKDHEVHEKVLECAPDKNPSERQVNCLRRLQHLYPMAIVSRTIAASAGMERIVTNKNGAYVKAPHEKYLQDKIWITSRRTMHIRRDDCEQLKHYFQTHSAAIAADNLSASCKNDSSCTSYTKDVLQGLAQQKKDQT